MKKLVVLLGLLIILGSISFVFGESYPQRCEDNVELQKLNVNPIYPISVDNTIGSSCYYATVSNNRNNLEYWLDQQCQVYKYSYNLHGNPKIAWAIASLQQQALIAPENFDGKQFAKEWCGGTCVQCSQVPMSWSREPECNYIGSSGGTNQDPVGGCVYPWYCDGRGNCITDKCHITEVYWEKEEGIRATPEETFVEGTPLKCVVKTDGCTANVEGVDIRIKSELQDKNSGLTSAIGEIKNRMINAEKYAIRDFPAKVTVALNVNGDEISLSSDKVYCEANLNKIPSIIKKSETIQIEKPCTIKEIKIIEQCKILTGPQILKVEAVTGGNCKDGEIVQGTLTRGERTTPDNEYYQAEAEMLEFQLKVKEIGLAALKADVSSMGINRMFPWYFGGSKKLKEILDKEDFWRLSLELQKRTGSPASIGTSADTIKTAVKYCPPQSEKCENKPGNCLQECDKNGNALASPKEVTTDAPECYSCIQAYCHTREGATGFIAARWLPYPNDNLACQIKDEKGITKYGTCLAGKCIAPTSKCNSKSCKNICGKDGNGFDTLQKYACSKGVCVPSGKLEIKDKDARCVDGGWVFLRRTFEGGIKLPLVGDAASFLSTAANDFLFLGISLPLKFVTRKDKGITSYYLKFKSTLPLPLIGGAFVEDKYCPELRRGGII